MRLIPKLEPRLLRTASFRLAAAYVVLFAASTLVLGGVVFWIASDALNQQLRARILAESAALQGEYRIGGLDRLVAAVRLGGRGAAALDDRVQAADGRRLAGTLPRVAPRPGWVDLEAGDARADGEADQTGEVPEHVRALVTQLPGGVWLAVGDDLGRIEEVQATILGAFAWALGLGVLLGGAGGVLLSRSFLRRVDTIGRTAQAIIAGDLTQRIPLRGTGDDLDRLAATLNRMLDRIAALMDSLRQVSADVAHDLRTPLARLVQTLDTARRHAATPEAFRAALDTAAEETEAILETFAALLRIAQVEGGSRRAGFRAVDLSALAASVGEAFAPSIEAAGHRFVAAITPGVSVRGDGDLLANLLANLLDNALRHTPAGSTIRLGLAIEGGAEAGRAALSVADDGPGVPAAERARIFDRFYRAEHSRTTPGSGLGLAMVAAIAELHEAALTAEDAGPGLRVRLVFPPG